MLKTLEYSKFENVSICKRHFGPFAHFCTLSGIFVQLSQPHVPMEGVKAPKGAQRCPSARLEDTSPKDALPKAPKGAQKIPKVASPKTTLFEGAQRHPKIPLRSARKTPSPKAPKRYSKTPRLPRGSRHRSGLSHHSTNLPGDVMHPCPGLLGRVHEPARPLAGLRVRRRSALVVSCEGRPVHLTGPGQRPCSRLVRSRPWKP